ncbi:hypothetical protein B0H16DRAFT_1805628 [Mycena metata]|uniref:Uncharacterized protein n=1 Tax=Mycena metata TaxID=1033252 RepID=A0AAD7JHQ1_9AGAR|nr:hypothetical protein B0H16DRAFT_1805628 [Mycena metata]
MSSKSVYDWSSSPDDPSYYTRRQWGFEILNDVLTRQKHQTPMFLGADIAAERPFVTTSLLEHARNAWVSLRFTLPTLAAHTEQDTEGNALLTYRTALSAADAQAWAGRTLQFHEEHKTLDGLHKKLRGTHIPDANGDQTFLHLIVRSDTSFAVLLYTSHVTFDGASAKIVITRFLKKLALLLDGGSPDLNLKWGDEYSNLTPAVVRVLGPNEVVEGDQYGETLNSVMTGFGAALAYGHGFKFRGRTGPGPTRHLGLPLSVSDTSKLLQFAKSNGLTVNQVVHAALMMVCVFDNPPTADTPADAAVATLGIVNPRYRLQSAYSGRDERDRAVDRSAHVLKTEYLKQKAYPSLLAILQHDAPPWMRPSYVGDGRGEDYLDRDYPGGDGTTILDLDEFFMSVFQAFSWRDRLFLSVNYNEHTMTAKRLRLGWTNGQNCFGRFPKRRRGLSEDVRVEH